MINDIVFAILGLSIAVIAVCAAVVVVYFTFNFAIGLI